MEGVAICDYCHNIRKWKRFNALKDYLACIEYIQQLVTNGGFELLEEESTCPLNQVKTEDGWADEIMVHTVRCKHCGQVFTCVVNTSRVPHSGVTVWWSARLIWVRSPCDPSRKLSTSDSK